MHLRHGLLALAIAAEAVALSVGSRSAAAQSAGALTGVRVSGIVFDSINAQPVRGAMVSLTRADSTARHFSAVTDTAGRFVFTGIDAGRYLLGFFHQAADSLGLEPSAVELTVGSRDTSVVLSIPSAATFARLACSETPPDDSTGLLIGHLRDNDTDGPLANAQVSVTWSELALAPGRWQTTGHTRIAQTSDQGWFGLCNVPSGIGLELTAHSGADSSGAMEVTVSNGGVRHVSLYVAHATGEARARLQGQVRSQLGIPVQDARVAVLSSDVEATTSQGGDFTIETRGLGTQTIQVRAIGYTPTSVVVRVKPQGNDRLKITMERRPVKIAGVTVTEKEFVNPRLKGFYDRLKDNENGLGFGTFMTQQDIEKRHPIFTTSLFEQVNGARVLPGRTPVEDVLLSSRNGCLVTVYLDGVQVGQSPDRINQLITPNTVAAIEFYPRAIDAPGQYQLLNGSCGIALFWTK